MSTHPATITRQLRTPASVLLVRRTASASLAALALSLGACDRASTTEAAPTAPDASTAVPFAAQRGDEAGVAAVVAAWDAAWNAGDAAGLAALFVDDAEFINGRGQIAVGAATIGAQHAVSLAGPFKGSRTQGRVRRITFVSGTTAVLDVDNELTGYQYLPPGTSPTEPGVQRGRHKRVLVKRGGVWRTLSMQLTTVAPAA
ncbi:MAG: SgcJ/EcaC family oxidoreductase [Gemmatirosa sp.]